MPTGKDIWGAVGMQVALSLIVTRNQRPLIAQLILGACIVGAGGHTLRVRRMKFIKMKGAITINVLMLKEKAPLAIIARQLTIPLTGSFCMWMGAIIPVPLSLELEHGCQTPMTVIVLNEPCLISVAA
jgi:hypothetical protein